MASEWERQREIRRKFEAEHPEILQMRGLLRAENAMLWAEVDRLRGIVREAGLEVDGVLPSPDMEELLRRPVADVAWPTDRISRVVESARWWDGKVWSDVKTLGDLVMCTKGDLLRAGDFGEASLNALKRMLAEMHLYLAPAHLPRLED